MTPPVTIVGTTEVELAPRKGLRLDVSYEDGRELVCTFDVRDGGAVELVGSEGAFRLVDGVTSWPCVERKGPRITWRPTVTVRGETLLAAEDIASVVVVPPFLRIETTEQAVALLCERTRQFRYHEAQVTTPDQVYAVHLQEARCDGVLSVPLSEEAVQGSQGAAAAADLVAATGLWPVSAQVHPLVAAMADDDEASIASVGEFLRQMIPDERTRLKAVHDWVATRVSYDMASLEPGQRAPQDADTVFRRRTGVCAGYANLMVTMGRAAGLEVVYVVGQSRDQQGGVSGSGHAWNAARVDGEWVLVDATWDAGGSKDGSFKANYKTAYFATPPEIFRITHLPDDDGWQLAQPALSLGEFTRLPMLRPEFYAGGMSLLSPDRSQVDVVDQARFEIANPKRRRLLAEFGPSDRRTRCKVEGETRMTVTCDFPECRAVRGAAVPV